MSQLIENKLVEIPADNSRNAVGVKKTVNFTIDIEQIISKREIKIVIKNYPLIMNEVLITKFGKSLNGFMQYFYKLVTEKEANNE